MPEIQMPKLSDTMTEGTLVAWKKKKGDKVTTGDVIAEIETDKATMEWESPEDGVLTEIYVEEGGKVDVGQKIAFIGEEGEAAPAEEKKEEAPKEKKEEAPKEEPKAETEKPAPAKDKKKETAPPEKETKFTPEPAAKKESKPPQKAEGDESARVKASPLARRLAAQEGLDISQVKGTGDEGRITSTDVHAAIKSKSSAAQKKPSAAVKPGEGSRIQHDTERQLLATLSRDEAHQLAALLEKVGTAGT
jgi:pyruvate dehydrogenase E2 component (dihydrolipoamide acetyltransferase)